MTHPLIKAEKSEDMQTVHQRISLALDRDDLAKAVKEIVHLLIALRHITYGLCKGEVYGLVN